MAKTEQSLVEALSLSSPLLSEAAPLLAEASIPEAGLPGLEELRVKPDAIKGVRDGDLGVAEFVGEHAPVVAETAPDVAILAPSFAVAAA
jgi:hypothetical protein